MNAIAFKVVLICVSKNSYKIFQANAQFGSGKLLDFKTFFKPLFTMKFL